jgi:uncharacterized OB-fold protein
MAAPTVAPMFADTTMEFPYKHSTGETIGRFLAGLKEQRRIWGQRVPGQGVVVPPVGYSETTAAEGGDWVAVANTGVVTAVAVVHEGVEGLHPAPAPFAFVLVKLDGADTALPHIVTEGHQRVRVGSRVEATWRSDEEREGSIRDIAAFRLID